MTRFGFAMASPLPKPAEKLTHNKSRPNILLRTLGDPDVGVAGIFPSLPWFQNIEELGAELKLERSVMPKSFRRPESRFQKLGPCTCSGHCRSVPAAGCRSKVCVPMTLTQLKFGSPDL